MSSKEYRELAWHLEWLEGQGSSFQTTTTTHDLCIGDSVTDCGHLHVELDETSGHARFDIELGPVNAMRLIKFLNELPNEPARQMAHEP